jgi:predicted class III extradiol MEMO1 family dioxygenase
MHASRGAQERRRRKETEMARLVYAGATSHVSGIIRSPDADPEKAFVLERGWQKMTADIAAADPDVVVLIGTDHQETYGLENYPVFAMGQAESYPAWNEHGIPGDTSLGTPEVSAQLRASLIESGIDLSVSMEMPLDHGYTVPVQRLNLGERRIVPLFVNCNELPLPTLRRCRQLGTALREAIAALPDDLTVAVIATGGVSHWVAVPRQGEINEEWDHRFLELVAEGDLESIVAMTDDEILEDAGNGALEIRTWVVASACAGERGGQLLAYAPMYPWVTGIGIMELAVEA